jgi:TPR repeat protein
MKIIHVLILVLCLCACSKPTDPKTAFDQGDFETSLKLWLPRAEAGDKEAQDYVGIQYAMGLGVRRDYNEAIKWFAPAAEAGYPDAQRNYGDMFQYGYGVPQDYKQAFIWYFAASQQGHETAKQALTTITDNNKLTPNQQMHAKLQANKYIPDPAKQFQSHDTYIEK